ncbi:MAG: hypothetical protein JNK23_03560 [Opitutaceae bacterium]|nr:hypothetical protein [Opitutaceae bacterium]
MRMSLFPAVALVAACLLPVSAYADPSGNWSWTQTVRPGVVRESRLTLVLKGKRVVGGLTSPGPRGEHIYADLVDGTFDGDIVAFTVVRDINGQKMTSKYRGKLLGPFINGTIEEPGVTGLTITREWSAKRVM